MSCLGWSLELGTIHDTAYIGGIVDDKIYHWLFSREVAEKVQWELKWIV